MRSSYPRILSSLFYLILHFFFQECFIVLIIKVLHICIESIYYNSVFPFIISFNRILLEGCMCVCLYKMAVIFCMSVLYSILLDYPMIFKIEILLLFSHQVMSNSLQPHGLQHTRLPYPSPFLRVCSDTCPLSRWCHPTISSSVIPFSSCPQSFPASGSFPMSQLFTSGGQSIGTSASVLPMNTQGWFPLGLTVLISLLFRLFSSTTIQKHQFFGAQPFLWSNCHNRTWLLEKTIALTILTFVAKWCLCFLMLYLSLS